MSHVAPHNLEAEENVLGAILLAENIPNDIIDTLAPKHFYRDTHRVIYQAALSLHAQGKPTTGIAVADELTKMGQLERIGGNSRIAELAGLVPTVSNSGHHAAIVREQAGLRELLNASKLIEKLVADRPGNHDELVRQAEEILYKASDQATTRSALPITEGLDELVADIRSALESGTPIAGTPTGFTALDNILHGMWPSQLIILAARTGQGKSTLAQNIAENVADAGLPALFFTLEMSRYELQLRALARAGRIDSDRLSTGLITKEEQGRMAEAIATVRKRTNLYIHDDGLANISLLASLARRHNERDALGLIVVDYIGLVHADGKNKYEQVSEVSRSLKLLAQNLKVPVLALAQMNRNQDGRSEKEPMLSDLRDSGSLEQDSDVVLFLHRESDHDSSVEDTGEVKLIVAKNRKGRSGYVKLNFNKASSRFLTQTTIPGGTT